MSYTPMPPLPLTHDQRYLNQRMNEWATNVGNLEPGTPHHLVLRYKQAFDAQTDAGRAIARFQDKLDRMAQQ